MTTTTTPHTVLYINENLAPTGAAASNASTTFAPPPPPLINVTPVEETKNVSSPASTTPLAGDKPITPPSTLTNITVVDKSINLQRTPSDKAVDVPLSTGSAPIATSEDPTTPKVPEDEAFLKGLEKLKETLDDEKTAEAFAKAGACMLLCGSACTLIVLGIISIIPLLKLIIGSIYSDECPVNSHIPLYLIVAGATELSYIGLSILNLVLKMCGLLQTDNRNSLNKWLTHSITAVLNFLNIFTIVWFIVGCVWVFGAWDKVQYKNPNQINYCVSTLYRFAFWLLFLSIIYHILTCCSTCTQFCSKSSNKKKRGAIPVPTTEP